MPRPERTDIGGYVYHVLNRANARVQIFDHDRDYQLFEKVLTEAEERTAMRILAYCIMPNHWHLVLYPRNDGDLTLFLHWLTMTHTQRWHAAHHSIGQGHLYQGRFKSFLCQHDHHFLQLVRYVERNAYRAHLVKRAEQWRWSSVWRREYGTPEQQALLAPWPVDMPPQYLRWLNMPQTAAEEEAIQRSMTRGNPYGSALWTQRMVRKFGLESTLQTRGRSKKGS